MSRETKFLGADGDRAKKKSLFSTDHEHDWQPYRVDPYSTKSADDIYSVEVITCFHFEGVRWCVTLRYH